MNRIFVINKKDHTYVSYSLDALCDDLNKNIIRPKDNKFFKNESDAIKFQTHLIVLHNQKRMKHINRRRKNEKEKK